MNPSRFLLRSIRTLFKRVAKRASRILHISGQAPVVEWRMNAGGLKRSIDEAIELARKNGVAIPEDVAFFEAEPEELKGTLSDYLSAGRTFESARGPGVTGDEKGRVHWNDHFNKDGRIPFQIHPDVLASDELIVAVFQHEIHELSLFRLVFMFSKDQTMDATDYRIQASTGRPSNFHDLAWREADALVLRMRESTE
jgi:hypothetical protein